MACPDMFWRCGDYNWYAALAENPNSDYLWLIENDVRINTDHYLNFFLKFDTVDADYLAIDLRQADQGWSWYKTIAPFIDRPWKCLFPITRISSSAATFLLAERKKLTRHFIYNGINTNLWPNDEAFSASFLHSAGLRCMDLNGLTTNYNKTTFGWRERPRSVLELSQSPRDQLIYHPVLSGEAYLKALKRAVALTNPLIFSDAV